MVLAQSADTKKIWEQLVKYTNADAFAREEPSFVTDFLALRQSCIQYIEPSMRMGADHVSDTFAEEADDELSWKTSVLKVARKHQVEVKHVLQWLAEPKYCDWETAQAAYRFLEAEVRSISWDRLFNFQFNPECRDAAFWIDAPTRFGRAMSPICEFIWRQMNGYRNGDGELKALFPIGVCGRPSCGRFFLIERIGRGSYCSSLCRASHWQSTHLDERRERDRERQLRKKQRELKRAEIGKAEPKKGKR